MSDDIIIGNANAGSMAVGGTGHTIESGILNNYGTSSGEISQLRDLIDELLVKVNENPVPPAVRASAEKAKIAAAEPEPDIPRLRALMNAVSKGAEKIAAITAATLNVINVINIIEHGMR
jgi:hypothetical protein